MKTQFLALIIAAASASAHAASLKVTSQALKAHAQMNNAQVFNSFGCSGENISPDLAWSGAPKETKSFAIMAYDPDAPTGSGWWHWVAFNIPADTTQLVAGASGKMPAGTIESRTDFGKPGYGGPCPPPGKAHRYIFHVYALKDVIPLDKDAPGAMVGFYAGQMKLAEGVIEAKYGRSK
jgi:hypothetical protein